MKGPRPTITDEQVHDIKALRDQGASWAEIEQMYGQHPTVIQGRTATVLGLNPMNVQGDSLKRFIKAAKIMATSRSNATDASKIAKCNANRFASCVRFVVGKNPSKCTTDELTRFVFELNDVIALRTNRPDIKPVAATASPRNEEVRVEVGRVSTSSAPPTESLPFNAVMPPLHTPRKPTIEDAYALLKEIEARSAEKPAHDLNALRDRCHNQAVDMGWHDKPRDDGTFIALMHSELSECLEGIRRDLMDDHLPHRKMAEVELADTIIRIMDYAGLKGYDIEGAVEEKLAHNRARADHQRENRAKPGGKAF